MPIRAATTTSPNSYTGPWSSQRPRSTVWRNRRCAVNRTDDIRAEIRSLRKGRGVLTADLYGRLGPNLRELAGVASRDSGALRRALVEELVGCAAQLAPDMQTVVLGALAISPDIRQLCSIDD